MQSMKRIVIYCRVSTEDQRDTGYSLDRQLRRCREWAKANEYVVVAYFQEDFTGTVIDRPKLVQALQILADREAEAIICNTPDRLSRVLAHRVLIREEIFALKCELIYVSSGVVDNSSSGILMDNLHGAMDQHELDRIRERTTGGREDKAHAGIPVGSGHPPLGYEGGWYGTGSFAARLRVRTGFLC